MSTTEQEVGDMDAENGEQTGGHVEQQQVEQPQAGESTQTTTTARGRPKKNTGTYLYRLLKRMWVW